MQLTIIIDDKVGKLAQILDVLTKENINIQGISTERGPVSEIRLIVDNPEKTKDKLENSGFIVYLTEVTGITLSDNSGELAKITSILRDANVSIEYIYRYGSENDNAKLVMHTTEEHNIVKQLLRDFTVI